MLYNIAMRQAKVSDVLKVFWQNVRPYKGRAFFIIFSAIGATAFETAQPWFLKQLFDLLEKQSPAIATISIFLPVISIMIGLKFASWICWRAMAICNNRFSAKVMASIEQGAFENLLRHSYQFFTDTFAGSLVKKVGRLSRAFDQLADEINYQFVPTIVVLVGGVIGLYLQFPALALAFILWVIAFIYFNYLASLWAVKLDVVRSQLDSEVGGALADAISNSITIKLFPALDFEADRFSEINQRRARMQMRSWDRHEIIFATQSILMIAFEAGIIYFSVTKWVEGVLTLGDIAFIQTYLILVFRKLWEMGRSFRHLFDAFADGKEMVEIMMLPHAVKDHRGAKELKVRQGKIEFKNVDFSFDPRRKVFDDFSLTIKPHEKIALVGPSGAGKSTVTKLLFRFYDINSGSIKIDGQDIAKVTQESLRQKISLVPQDPILFHRTLMENIRYGRRDASDEEVIEAARKAHCHEFIAQLSAGYETYVGERGVKLSGGERQRVAIARAILANAPILVLDEATSSLDSESESLIQDALHELMADKTVIVVAHRLSTIMEMDRILVIENGTIASQGTHDDLLKEKGTYKRLWSIQAGGFRS